MSLYHAYPDHFSEASDFPRVDRATAALVLASTARSGSNMLAHALHETGCFGFPLEYANPAYVKEWMRILGTTGFNDTLEEVVRRRTSPSGVFGIKVHYWQIRQFGGFEELGRFLPNPSYVLLTRRNVVKQAVSWSIAAQTGIWIDGQEAIAKGPRYDFEDIDWRLRRTIIDSAQWRYLLAASGYRYMELVFEDIVGDIGGAVVEVARFMDVSIDGTRIPQRASTKSQRKAINAEWEARFLRDRNPRTLLTGRLAEIVPRGGDQKKGVVAALRKLVRR